MTNENTNEPTVESPVTEDTVILEPVDFEPVVAETETPEEPAEPVKKKRKSRLKNPEVKVCVDCNETKDRFADFRPRKSRCEGHMKTPRKDVPADCEDCQELRNSVIRQPRCLACDSARGKAKTAERQAKRAAEKAAQEPEPAVAVVVETPAEPVIETEEVVAEAVETEPSVNLVSTHDLAALFEDDEDDA